MMCVIDKSSVIIKSCLKNGQIEIELKVYEYV